MVISSETIEIKDETSMVYAKKNGNKGPGRPEILANTCGACGNACQNSACGIASGHCACGVASNHGPARALSGRVLRLG